MPSVKATEKEQSPLQRQFYDVIFGVKPGAGRNFDILLMILILISVAVVLLDSMSGPHQRFSRLFLQLEWFFTILFSIEYAVRIWCSPNRKAYIFSTYGIVDLLAIVPTYVALFVPAASSLLLIRMVRILRVFRVLRLLQFLKEANVLARSLANARRKILVFFACMLIITTIFGCLMYVIEGPGNGFSSIPKSIYWAIITITTVGYGDVVPQTALGQALASVSMLVGYAIIAVPTGVITAELAQEISRERNRRSCSNCERGGHEVDAKYCKHCGTEL